MSQTSEFICWEALGRTQSQIKLEQMLLCFLFSLTQVRIYSAMVLELVMLSLTIPKSFLLCLKMARQQHTF